MSDHDHDAQVAVYGECVVCATRPPEQGRARRDEALAVVAAATPDDWTTLARQAVTDLAAEGRDFTADDLWVRLPTPPEPRALGAVLTWAASEGLITGTDRYQPSTRPERHAAPIRIWTPLR